LIFYTEGIGSYSTVPPTRVPPLYEYPARKKLSKNWYDYDPLYIVERTVGSHYTDHWISEIPDRQIPKHKNLWISQKQTAGSPKTEHWIPKLLTTGPEKKRRTVGSQNTDHWLSRRRTTGSQETDRWIHKYRPLDLKKRTAGSTKPAE